VPYGKDIGVGTVLLDTCGLHRTQAFAGEGECLQYLEKASRYKGIRKSSDVGKKTGVIAIIESVRSWVREDAIRSLIDPNTLKPVARLGVSLTQGRRTGGRFRGAKTGAKDRQGEGRDWREHAETKGGEPVTL
jgi:hypothetical protein